jgi:hypothetical protein
MMPTIQTEWAQEELMKCCFFSMTWAQGAAIVVAFQFALLSSHDVSDIQPIHQH